MLGYEAYRMLIDLWRNEKSKGKTAAGTLWMGLVFFCRNIKPFALAFLNVIPQIGFGVVRVARDFENPILFGLMLTAVLVSTTTSNWLIRGKPMAKFLESHPINCRKTCISVFQNVRAFKQLQDAHEDKSSDSKLPKDPEAVTTGVTIEYKA